MSQLLEFLANLVISVISHSGLLGVAGLMTLESTGIPIPSEVIMPFAGFLAANGQLSFWLAVLAGTIGNIAGSLVAYYIAAVGGRSLVERYGRVVLLSKRDLDQSEQWFKRYGGPMVLVGRLLPIIRTYISFPAGLAEMPLGPFVAYTAVGSLFWSWLLAWFGFTAGNNWEALRGRFHGFDTAIAALIMLGIIWWIWRHVRSSH